MIAVCLRSVRLEVREEHAKQLARNEARLFERVALLRAASCPSARVYHLPESVRPIYERVAA